MALFFFYGGEFPRKKPSRISNGVEHSPIPKFKSDDYKYISDDVEDSMVWYRRHPNHSSPMVVLVIYISVSRLHRFVRNHKSVIGL